MKANPERWLPVVGFEGLYEVSDHGRVRSLDRIVSKLARGRLTRYELEVPGRLLRIIRDDSGRRPNPCVSLCHDANKKKMRLAALVLEAFVG